MYALGCYFEGSFVGYFYTYLESGYERYTWSKQTTFTKTWKTEKGAEKNLKYYQERLDDSKRGITLKIEKI